MEWLEALRLSVHPHVQHALAERFIAWVTSPAGQSAIASYRVGGEQAFFPDVGR